MEVLLQSLEGIPENSILSIRCGTTRRQAPVNAIDKPFRFPCKPEDCAAVKIDLFHHVATARTVTEAGTSEHKLLLEEVSNAGSQTFDSNLGVSFQMRPATKGAKHMGDGLIEATRKRETDSLMDKYLADHNVMAFLQGILQGLVKEQPENPYSFIARQFVAEAAEKEEFVAEAAEKEVAEKKLEEKVLDPEPTPPPSLQGEVLNCLLRGSETGDLERLLSQTQLEAPPVAPIEQQLEPAVTNAAGDMESVRKFLEEAKSESAFLKQTLDGFQNELEKRIKENNELKSLLKEDRYFAQKDVKDTSRNQDDLRQQTAQSFFNAASSSRLDDIFNNLREGVDVGTEVTIQQQAQKIQDLESKLEKAAEAISIKERSMAGLIGDMEKATEAISIKERSMAELMGDMERATEAISWKERSMAELMGEMAKLENKYNEEQKKTIELAALVENLQAKQQEKVPSKEEEEENLRLQARGMLTEALEIGTLQEAFALTKEEEELRLQAQGMFAEALRTGALQEALPQAETKEEEELRLQARGMFAEALRTGALQEALPQAGAQSNEKMDMLRSKAMETLAKGAREKRDSLDSSVKTPIPNTMDTLRSRARETLINATNDGQLKDALNSLDSSMKTPIPNTMDTLRSRARETLIDAANDGQLKEALKSVQGDAKRADTADVVPQIDLSNVQELHAQLEKLAKDRVVLLQQVNEVRGLVNEVAAENNKLAKEVLSRPLSPEGEEALSRNAEFLSTYGTSSSTK